MLFQKQNQIVTGLSFFYFLLIIIFSYVKYTGHTFPCLGTPFCDLKHIDIFIMAQSLPSFSRTLLVLCRMSPVPLPNLRQPPLCFLSTNLTRLENSYEWNHIK